MPELEYFLVSRYATVDVESGAVSFFHVVDQLQAEGFPTIVPELCAASCWRVNSKDRFLKGSKIQLKVSVPGMEPRTLEFKIEQLEAGNRQRNIARLEAIPLRREGVIEFEVSWGDASAKHLIPVKKYRGS